MSTGPQVEDGNYTRIHNDILEAIAGNKFSASEYACLIALLRMTYGWQKKADAISYGQLAQMTNLPRRTVIRAMASLEARHVIVRIKALECRAQVWQFNKYFDGWQGTPTSDTGDTSTSDIDDTRLTPTSDTGDTKTSDTGDTHQRKKERTTTDTNVSAPMALPSEPIMVMFREVMDQLRAEKANRPAILREFYVRLYGNGDGTPDYGYFGKAAKQVGGAGHLAELLLQHCTRPPTGDILTYIIAAEKRRKSEAQDNRAIQHLTFEN